MKRERWSSNLVFVLAAVGSAVGLGNIWRFPYLAGKYGGGFLIPYLIALLATGIPLLKLEFAIGQKYQKGIVESFSKIKKEFAVIGMGAIITGFIVVSYYGAVIAWIIKYLLSSPGLEWGVDTKTFFFSNVLQMSTGVSEVGGVVPEILLMLFIVWVLVYISIWKGVKSIGLAATITMPLPVIILLILFIRGITLPGASLGLSYYLKPDFNALLDIEIWNAAFSQIFFTLSIGFGIMIAYASFNDKKENITKNAILTATCNSIISIIAGFAVFSTLGYMSLQTDIAVSELAVSGPGLVFIVLPKALSLFPYAPVFAVLFFAMLLSLGINSAFSLVEAVVIVVYDHTPKYKREFIALLVCILGFISGIIFTCNAGLYYLDVIDHFITGYGLIFIGLLEVVCFGWFSDISVLRKYINQSAGIKTNKTWEYLIKFIIPIVLSSLLLVQFIKDIKEPYGKYPEWTINIFGWGMLIVILQIMTFMFIKIKRSNKTQKTASKILS